MLIYQNIKNRSFRKLRVKKKMLWNTDPPFLTIVYWTPYPLYFDHTIHGIVKPSLIFNCESSKIAMEYTTPPMVYRTPFIWYFPYPWYCDCPLPMEYQTPSCLSVASQVQLYGILNLLPMTFWPPSLVLNSESSKIAMLYWPPHIRGSKYNGA